MTTSFNFTLHQAVNLYHAAFLPPVVGGTAEEPAYGPSEASALARHLDLPWHLSSGTSTNPDSSTNVNRRKVAAMLRAWADAIDSPAPEGGPT